MSWFQCTTFLLLQAVDAMLLSVWSHDAGDARELAGNYEQGSAFIVGLLSGLCIIYVSIKLCYGQRQNETLLILSNLFKLYF